MTLFKDKTFFRAYIEVSVDAVDGDDQMAERLWEAIATKYHE